MRRLAKGLPWAAALSFAAFVSTGAYTMFASDFRTMFPVALGLGIVVGVPLAVQSRGGVARTEFEGLGGTDVTIR